VRERIHERGVHREHGIEEMREAGDQAEERAVAVEAPWAARLDKLDAWLVVPVEDLVRHPPVRPAIHDGQGVRAMLLHAHDGNRGVGEDAADRSVGLEILESHALQIEE
jgi:hypothetical protein